MVMRSRIDRARCHPRLDPRTPGTPGARDRYTAAVTAPTSDSAARSSLRELTPSFPNTLRQVPLHRAGAEEQLGADLGVRLPVGGEARDLHLLWGQLVERLDRALAHRLAGGQQLAAGALGERVHAHVREHRVSDSQLLAGVDAAVLAPQPFAVQEVRAGQRSTRGCGCATAVRSPPGRAARPWLPRRASPPRARGSRAPSPCRRHAQSQRAGRADRSRARAWPLRTAASIELREHPDRLPQPARVLGGPLGRGQGVLVPAEPVVTLRAAPLVGGDPEPLAASQYFLPARLDQRQRLGVPSRASSPA